MYDYLVVGAGLFGAVFTRIMLDNGKTCLVVEKRNHIGGNIYTENVDGVTVHKYGAHIFHTSDETVWDFVNRYASFNSFVNMPKANFKGELFSLPFNMNTFHELWGLETPKEAEARIKADIADEYTETPKNLEEQAVNLVGREIYEKLVKGYTEKQWGRACDELPPFIIKRLPLRFTYDNNYFNDKYQGIPTDSYTAMIERLLDGAKIMLDTDYLKKPELRKIAKTVVFTGRIDEYFGFSLGELEYRSLRFETETLPVEDFQGNAVVNYTEREIPFTRIIEHKHFSGEKCDSTVITREYPQEFNGKNEPYYPVNDEKNNTLYEKYKALAAKEKKVIFGGRLGLYRYLDMDKIVAEAIKLTSFAVNIE